MNWTFKKLSGVLTSILALLACSSVVFGDELHDAVKAKDGAKVKVLLERGANVNQKDKEGMTPLHRAAENNAKNIAGLLIAKGADVNAKDNGENEGTPLHVAVGHNAKDVVALLLDKGADVNVKDDNDWTPLHVVAAFDARAPGGGKNAKEIAELLLAKGADVKARTNDGRTPLALALRYDHNDIAVLFRTYGAKE